MTFEEKTRGCDVIIPVYNGEKVINDTLKALFCQSLPRGWYVRLIVVDDGSSDKTAEIIKKTVKPSSWQEVIYVKQPHAGASRARNKGIKLSRGDVVFFLGADIILRPNVLKRHLLWHAENANSNHGVLGMVKWDPRLKPTPLMEWMVHGGQQNDFDGLLGENTVSPKHFFYGSHLSIKRSVLKNNHFSEEFDVYGWEDLELGRRLAGRGVKLQVLSEALALHNHYYDVDRILRRQYAIGQGAVTYQTLYPQEDILQNTFTFKRWRRLLIIHSGLLVLMGFFLKKTASKLSMPRLFLGVTTLYFWKGVYIKKRSSWL